MSYVYYDQTDEYKAQRRARCEAVMAAVAALNETLVEASRFGVTALLTCEERQRGAGYPHTHVAAELHYVVVVE